MRKSDAGQTAEESYCVQGLRYKTLQKAKDRFEDTLCFFRLLSPLDSSKYLCTGLYDFHERSTKYLYCSRNCEHLENYEHIHQYCNRVIVRLQVQSVHRTWNREGGEEQEQVLVEDIRKEIVPNGQDEILDRDNFKNTNLSYCRSLVLN